MQHFVYYPEVPVQTFFQAVLARRKAVVLVFLAVTLISALLISKVVVNYNMVDYLPKGTNSTEAINIMRDEFGGELPNANVMINGVTVQQALEYKEKLAAVKGITEVTWLDNVIGIDVLKGMPLEYLDKSTVEAYYKDNAALFSLTVARTYEKDAVAEIYEIIGEDNAVTGDAVSTAMMQIMSRDEVIKAMFLLVPLIIAVLIFVTRSWFEPILFLVTIGVAVLINMGTNLFFGDVSFITRTVSPILQLAVSLDYAVFLLHSYHDYREQHAPQEAMALAMKSALSSVAASAATTVIGFLALVFMRFGIGSDLGVNLAKGILLSFISVMTFLPAFTLMCDKILTKTGHKNFVPNLKGLGKFLLKLRVPFLILVIVLVIPSFLGQRSTNFIYGIGSAGASPRADRDVELVADRFGDSNVFALLVPKESAGKEAAFCAALEELPIVNNVIAYTTAVGKEIPPEYVPKSVSENFYSEHYARILVYTDLPAEGDTTFAATQTIRDLAAGYYDTYYMAGQSSTLYDMRSVVESDMRIVNLIAIAGIFIVLLLTFKSLLLPLVLLFSIETAIWINLAIPYFLGMNISFIGYLIINTVQLGATVDYAILLTNRYLEARRLMPKFDAIKKALSENLIAIMISASILAMAGYILSWTSTSPLISELGMLLGQGTLLSFTLVACVLPALLVLFDRLIPKTTLKTNFYKTPKSEESKV